MPSDVLESWLNIKLIRHHWPRCTNTSINNSAAFMNGPSDPSGVNTRSPAVNTTSNTTTDMAVGTAIANNNNNISSLPLSRELNELTPLAKRDRRSLLAWSGSLGKSTTYITP